MAAISGIRDIVLIVGMVTVLVGHMARGACDIDECGKLSIRSTTAPCLQKLSIIEDFSTFETSTVLSAAACVSKCHVNSLCDLAVFEGPLQGSCSLMEYSNTGPVSPVPFPLNKTGCVVMTVNSPRCQNCGVPRRYTCECVKPNSGLLCETIRWAHCGPAIWMAMTLSNMRDAQEMLLPVKMFVTYSDQSQYFQRVDTVRPGSAGKYVILSEPSLSVDHAEEAFAIPATMEFTRFGALPSMTTVKLLLNGSVYEDPAPLLPITFMAMNSVLQRNGYITYDSIENTGDSDDILSGLTQGHRLLSRSLVTTVFNPDTSRVSVTTTSMQADYSELDFDFMLPLELTATTYTMHDSQRTRVKYAFGEGLNGTESQTTGKRWDIDNCWYPIPSVVATQTIGILREEVLRGKEVRVLMESGDVISADTLHVTLTPKDVVVELAPTVKQVNNSGPFTFERVAVSVRKTIAYCNRVLGKSQIVRHDHSLFTGKLTWIMSHHLWTEIYRVDANGQGQGDLLLLHSLVFLSEEPRVCVEFSELETLCISDGKIILKPIPSESILFQTRAFIKPSFTSDGVFHGFMDPACQSTEYLVSTNGWIKAVSYVIGNPEVTVQHNVTFKMIVWFLKDFI